MKNSRKNENQSKEKALETAINMIKRAFGEGAIMQLGDEKAKVKVPVISTGILTLDIALGTGGIPRGRITEIYGHEASGKTSLALSIVAQAQKGEGYAAYIDAENALDPNYAKLLGVDVKHLLVSQPDTGEQAFEIADSLVRSGAVDVIVVDSVAALVPKAEIEGDFGNAQIGLQARLMSQALRKLAGSVNRSKVSLIFINQIRQKISTGFHRFGGAETTTTGGLALKFYSSVRIEMHKGLAIKTSSGDVIGTKINAKIVKNKLAPPFRTATFDLYYNKGFSREACILDLALENKLITKSGSWFSYKDQNIGQGRENAIEFLENHPEIALKLENEIRSKYGLPLIEAGEKNNDTPGSN